MGKKNKIKQDWRAGEILTFCPVMRISVRQFSWLSVHWWFCTHQVQGNALSVHVVHLQSNKYTLTYRKGREPPTITWSPPCDNVMQCWTTPLWADPPPHTAAPSRASVPPRRSPWQQHEHDSIRLSWLRRARPKTGCSSRKWCAQQQRILFEFIMILVAATFFSSKLSEKRAHFFYRQHRHVFPRLWMIWIQNICKVHV